MVTYNIFFNERWNVGADGNATDADDENLVEETTRDWGWGNEKRAAR